MVVVVAGTTLKGNFFYPEEEEPELGFLTSSLLSASAALS
jgi:hypothetical protein